jgi:hypothetical protein
MKRKTKHFANISLNTIIFILLIGSAFAVSYWFGLFFVFGFAISIHNKDIKKKPWRMILLFIGGLITRLALGELLSKVSNVEITLDFLVAILMIIFIFLLGWKAKRV